MRLCLRHFLICRLIITFAVVALVSADRVVDAQDDVFPKTLFRWSQESAEPQDEEHEDKIVTDRPHFSEASSLVGLGRVQIETGYTYVRDSDNGSVVQTHSFGEPLLRAGLFAEWFEFRLGYTYLVEQSRTPGGPNSRFSGSDDLYVGAKLALTEQSGWLPEMAIFPQARIPTGSSHFTNSQVLPGFNLAYSWKLNDWIELECNTQLNRRRDDFSHFYTEFIQTANVEYDLTDRIGAFTEWIVFVPSGSLTAQTEHYFHGGFVYLLSNDVQIDIHSAIGLNRPADNLAFTGMGLSFRF